MSKLTEIGRAAMRAALLAELERCEWNMTHAGERLEMGGGINVLRSIRLLGLTAEYEAAKAQGLIRTGGRRPRKATTDREPPRELASDSHLLWFERGAIRPAKKGGAR